MPNLYDQLLALQRIPGAYERWTEYRRQVTDFIREHTAAGASVLIVGAGACGDFDLVRLGRHFGRLRLLDRDDVAMAEGLARQGVTLPRADVIRADLLGVSDEAYRALADRLLLRLRQENGQAAGFETCLLAEFRRALAERRPDSLTEQGPLADYVVCSGVHSQLLTVFLQMARVYRRYAAFPSEAVEAYIREQVPHLGAELNDTLFRWAERGLILGLEEGCVGVPGGIDGPWQAQADLSNRGRRPEAQTRLTWPFDPAQGKVYTMALTHWKTERESGV